MDDCEAFWRKPLLSANYLEQESFALQGAFFEVYRNLGCGFLEEVYQESLELELKTAWNTFRFTADFTLELQGVCVKADL